MGGRDEMARRPVDCLSQILACMFLRVRGWMDLSFIIHSRTHFTYIHTNHQFDSARQKADEPIFQVRAPSFPPPL